jgi:hypothetical protein
MAAKRFASRVVSRIPERSTDMTRRDGVDSGLTEYRPDQSMGSAPAIPMYADAAIAAEVEPYRQPPESPFVRRTRAGLARVAAD